MLARLRDELRGAIAKRLGWRLAAALVAGLWCVLVLDRLFEPSAGVRMIVGLIAAAGALGWLLLVAAPRIFRPIRDRDLLTLLNRTRQREVALIATAIDLRQGPLDGGAQLAEQTINDANRVAGELRDASLTRRAAESGWPWFTLVAAAGLAGVAIARGDLAAAFARRLALAETPWPRRVELIAEGFTYDDATGEWRRHAPRGEPIELAITARVAAGETPPRTVWSRGGGSATRLAALTRVGAPKRDEAGVAQRFRRRIERLDSDIAFTLWGGDGRVRLRLLATQRPRVVDLRIVSRPPEYLGGEATEASLATLDTLPEGSRVTIRGTSTRPLRRLAVFTQADDTAPAPVETVRIAGDGRAFEATLPSLGETVLVTLDATDRLGLDAERETVTLDCLADRPPSVSLALDGVGRAITRDAIIGATVGVDDDHGLREVSLRLQCGEQRAEMPLSPGRLPGTIPASADLLSLRSSGPNRLTLGVGDRLRLSAHAQDNYDLAPRAATDSQPIDLEIVTPAELLARLGESQRRLSGVVESLQADAERLAYEIDLGRRRLQETPLETGTLARWAAERRLDARKATRGVDEAAERADGIRRQVVANRLEQPALVDRLEGAVVGPLRRVSQSDLQEAERLLNEEGADALAAAEAAARRAGESLAQVAASLDSQQTYNEVVSLLRGLIREQRRVNERTSKRQSDRVRSLFD